MQFYTMKRIRLLKSLKKGEAGEKKTELQHGYTRWSVNDQTGSKFLASQAEHLLPRKVVGNMKKKHTTRFLSSFTN